MRKENYIRLLFAGVAALFLMYHSTISIAATCTAPDEVQSAGYCWKDRNLGASQVAENSDDSLAYGDLYQWGRLGDGHQNRNSNNIPFNILTSANDVPGYNYFITTGISPFDWRVPQNNNLWQGLGGINNPCPQGFRLPTETELNAERISWSYGNNTTGAFESPLHLVVAGFRSHFTGDLSSPPSSGCYWSSTSVFNIGESIYVSRYLNFSSAGALMRSFRRASALSIRCIKD